MSDWFSRQFGDQSHFALRVALSEDPYPSGSDAFQALWGSFEVWAQGRCLTRSQRDGEGIANAVVWSMLPILSWLSEVGIRLVNEDPYPRFSKGLDVVDACDWYERTATPPLLDPEREERWFLRRSEWRHHHALRRADEAVALPNVVFRRQGEAVEVSWDNENWPPAHPGLRFVDPRGRVAVAALEFATVLLDASRAVLEAVCKRFPDVSKLAELRDRFNSLAARSSDWRWLVHRPTAELIESDAELREVRARLHEHVDKTAHGLFVAHSFETGLLRQVRLESAAEISALLKFAEAHDGALDPAFIKLVRPAPVTPQRPWEAGNERAESLRDELGWKMDAVPALDQWLRQQGCDIEENDLGLPRYVALVSRKSDHSAGVHLNPRASLRSSPGVGLATALGHLLMDEEPCAIQGDWEDWGRGKRARAFAVALFLPEAGIRDELRGNVDEDGVERLMRRYGTGVTATTMRLHNLGFISQYEQQDLERRLSRHG
ncbi:MAG: hypothetical protein SFW67_11805 [Myxococcaceae bacterium]|nr:hypothetical protein [Myxococcaceae bacterium]